MNNDLIDLIDEAILLELNLFELYMLFYRRFSEDTQFWWKLAIEEQNHAALLKTAKQMERSHIQIPREILPAGLEELEASNRKIVQAIEKFEILHDRNKAFQFAHNIENSAGEIHYDTFMNSEVDSHVQSVFQKLNGEDTHHAERIRKYMIDHHIPQAASGF